MSESTLEHHLNDLSLADPQPASRRLGETETSYYLPSRDNGVNDIYQQPVSAEQAVSSADTALDYRTQNSDALIDSYLNGPRTLSNERLSYLVVSSTESEPDGDETERNIDILICATHYLGDGMALHQFAHDFFKLLGGDVDDAGLFSLLETEIASVKQSLTIKENEGFQLPLSLESRLPPSPPQRIHGAISLVDHLIDQRKSMGGHSFPRRSGLPRRTIVPTVSYSIEKTKHALKKCKERGVSISSAIFALCNVAWAKTHRGNWELPMMMYSALNLRPYLQANERLNNSYWFLAIGYFNIVLPAFLPREGDISGTFWHRARLVKNQTAKIAKSPMIVARSKEMAKQRGIRARMWAMQDDGVECTIRPPKRVVYEGSVDAPSKALIGLSLLGNLDGIYKHQAFPSIRLHTLTTGSRQREGGMLLFGYTFVNKLWLSLGYDVNGFDDDIVQEFWKNLLASVDELLLT